MNIRKLLKTLLIIGIGYGIMTLIRYGASVAVANGQKTASQTEIEWKNLNYNQKNLGNSNLSLITPFEVREIPRSSYENSLPSEWTDVFSEIKFYNSTGIEFNSNLAYFKFKSRTPNVEDYLNSMANGGIRNFEKAEGISNVKVKIVDKKISGLTGKEINGTFNLLDKPKILKTLIFTNGDYVWNFSFLYNPKKNEEHKTIQSIINSITIKQLK